MTRRETVYLQGSAGSPGPAGGAVAESPGARYFQLRTGILGALANVGIGGGALFAIPFMLLTDGTLDSLAVRVTVAGAAGNQMRVGIYSSLGRASGYIPDALLVDSGVIATDTIGQKTIGVNVSLSAGTWYWSAFLATAGNTAQLTGTNSVNNANGPIGHTDGSLNLAADNVFFSVFAFAALPATFPAIGGSTGQSVPHLFGRFSA